MANSNVSVVMAGIRGGCVMPAGVYNGSLGLNLYFTDLSGAYQSWSGDATYTVSLKIRRPSGWDVGVNNGVVGLTGLGSLDISDGVTTRTLSAQLTNFGRNIGAIYGLSGLCGGFAGAAAGDSWIFNGGAGGAGVSAAAVWAGTRVTAYGTASQSASVGSGAAFLQADSVGARGALVFSNNTLVPYCDAQSDRLVVGDASHRERVLLRVVPVAIVSTTSFTAITSGWSVSIPFTDEQFLEWSSNTTDMVSAFSDYPVEIVVATGGGALVALVTSAFRVYRKQIHLAL